MRVRAGQSRIPTRDRLRRDLGEGGTPGPACPAWRPEHQPRRARCAGARPVGDSSRPICPHAAPPPSAAPSPPARLPKTCKGLEVAEAGQAESSWGAGRLRHAPRDPCGCSGDAGGSWGCFGRSAPRKSIPCFFMVHSEPQSQVIELETPWRQLRGKSQVNLPWMPSDSGTICVVVD